MIATADNGLPGFDGSCGGICQKKRYESFIKSLQAENAALKERLDVFREDSASLLTAKIRIQDENARLEEKLVFKRKIIGKHSAELERIEAENARLHNFLQIAVDAHDDEIGEIDPEKYPKHWTVQAKAILAEREGE